MIEILLLGDSITFGVINGDLDEREQTGGYRTVLFRELVAHGFENPTDFDLLGDLQDGPGDIDRDHAGYRGATVDKIDDRVEVLLLQLPKVPDVVLLMAGTNDVAKTLEFDDIPQRLSQLLDRLLDAGVPHVLLGSIPPLATRESAIGYFNQALPGLADSKGDRVRFVDVSGGLTLQDLSADGIHPTAQGYEILGQNWAQALLPLVREFNTIPVEIDTDDLRLGDSQDNVFAGFGGQDTLVGLLGNDTLNGNTGNDLVLGNQGSDVLEGGKGDDTLWGGNESDLLSGNIGNDILSGDYGSDILFGNTETDQLLGGEGNDVLLGGQGDDSLDGSLGDDILRGDRGNDWLTGGEGRDIFELRAVDSTNWVTDFVDGQDAIGLTDLSFDQLTLVSDLNHTQIVFGNSILILQGVMASDIDESDFLQVPSIAL